jgi:hypothetical protein
MRSDRLDGACVCAATCVNRFDEMCGKVLPQLQKPRRALSHCGNALKATKQAS